MPQTWLITRDLRLSIVMGLRKGLRLVRGMRRTLTEEEQFRIADEIAADLKLSNWDIRPGEPAPGHSQLNPGNEKSE
jgi:hypothetical protein